MSSTAICTMILRRCVCVSVCLSVCLSICVCICFLSLSSSTRSLIQTYTHTHTHAHTHTHTQAQEEYTQQHTWLETQLKAAKDDGATHTLLFTHHPLFLQRDDEEEDVSVLGSSSFITHRGDEVSIPNTYFHIPRERREKILELMHKYGSRCVCMCVCVCV